MNIFIKYKRLFVYLLITFIAFISRYYLFEGRNSWHDEWHSIYVADPTISNELTLKRFYGDKGDTFLTEYYPPLYLFILKYFFMLFGYVEDYGRWLSLIFGTLTVPLSMYLFEILSNNKRYYITGLLISFNLFLIWQSLEIRAHSIFVTLAIFNIILFYKILEKKSMLYYIIYFKISVLLLSLWPITGAVFFGKTIYLIKEYLIKKKLEINIFIIFTLILVAYIFLNFDYLKFNLNRNEHYTTLYKSFFINYHFRTFFGSITLGGIFLVIFTFLLIKNLNEVIFLNSKQNVIIYIIISSYFLTLSYTILRASIMSPKYIMFVLPLIILWIGLKINSINISTNSKKIEILLIFISFVLFVISKNDSPIKRPPTKEIVKIIVKENINYIVTKENDVFNNYLRTNKNILKNNIIILNSNDMIPKNVSNFWFLCQNYPSYAVGDIGSWKDRPRVNKKCKDFNPSDKMFYEVFPFINDTQDYLIRKFKRKNN